ERIRIYDKGVDGSDSTEVGVPMSYRYGDITSPYIEFEEPLLVQNRHFLECINTGVRPASDGRSGLEVVRVLEAADQSMRTGRIVDIEDRPETEHRRAS